MRSSPFSQFKAKAILSESRPTLHGHPITKKQRGMLGIIAGGQTPRKLKKKSTKHYA